MSTECTVPPVGWKCTRAPGHEGPCAAVPVAIHGTIYIQGIADLDPQKAIHRGTYGSSDLSADLHVMWKAREFKGAARRQNKVLVIDFVPRWKAALMRLIGVRVGE